MRELIRLNALVACLLLSACAHNRSSFANSKRDAAAPTTSPQIVSFKNGSLQLGGELFLPDGEGPFPIVLYNHGSAGGMSCSFASKTIAPFFTAKGWGLFMPYRRGQGLSAKAGRYILEEVGSAAKDGGNVAAAEKMVRLLKEDHLSDQLAALEWLRTQPFSIPSRIAVAGNSFGGIEVVFGAASAKYCAAVDASGAAETWAKVPSLQREMRQAVRNAKAPIFFFQSLNDFDTSPSRTLSEDMKAAGTKSKLVLYPPFGGSAKTGHSFAYAGASIWFDDVFDFINKNCR